MFAPLDQRRNYLQRTFWSILVHAAILALIVHSSHLVRFRASLPGTPHGARIELSYLPWGAPVPTLPVRRKQPAAIEKPRLSAPLQPEPTPEPLLQQPRSTAQSGRTTDASNDALGSDDIRIALTTFSPSPKPDLTHLPHGAQGEVVLDVTIDPTGQVADLEILQALGYGIDGAVADTVRTWKFTPATKDGVPVASVQELHFHYGPV